MLISELAHIFSGTSPEMVQKARKLMYDAPRKLVPLSESRGKLKLPKSEQRLIFEHRKLIFALNKKIEKLELEKLELSPDDIRGISAVEARIKHCLREIALSKNSIREIKKSAFNNQKSIDEIV